LSNKREERRAKILKARAAPVSSNLLTTSNDANKKQKRSAETD